MLRWQTAPLVTLQSLMHCRARPSITVILFAAQFPQRKRDRIAPVSLATLPGQVNLTGCGESPE
jgi:Fe2+ transport system protein B